MTLVTVEDERFNDLAKRFAERVTPPSSFEPIDSDLEILGFRETSRGIYRWLRLSDKSAQWWRENGTEKYRSVTEVPFPYVVEESLRDGYATETPMVIWADTLEETFSDFEDMIKEFNSIVIV